MEVTSPQVERSTEMTKAEAINIINIAANAQGFKTREGLFGLPEIVSDNMNFFFTAEETHFNYEARCIEYNNLTFRASISRMGGNPTTAELVAQANETLRAASLVDYLNLLNISYIETVED